MKIDRLDYSSNPWRLLMADGREVYAPTRFLHPNCGPTTISMPVCGKTRRECEAKTLDLMEHAMTLLAEAVDERDRLRGELATLIAKYEGQQ